MARSASRRRIAIVATILGVSSLVVVGGVVASSTSFSPNQGHHSTTENVSRSRANTNCGHGRCRSTTTVAPITVVPTTSTTTTVPATTSSSTTTTPLSDVISACGPVAAGSYILEDDLPAPISGQCLGTFASGVTVDCQGHQAHSAFVFEATDVTLANCGFDGFVHIADSHRITVASSAFTNNANARLWNTTDSDIGTSTFVSTGSSSPGVSIFDSNDRPQPTNNYIHDNRMDGGSTGQRLGFDDGIVLQGANGESIDGDRVLRNTITNYFDAGIESVGRITNTIIAGNDIDTAYVAGIGAWFWDDWTHNTVTDNRMTNVLYAFYFYNKFGSDRGSADPVVHFSYNTFTRTTIVSYMPTGGIAVAAVFQFVSIIQPVDPFTHQDATYPITIEAVGNVVSDTDFLQSRYAPQFMPPEGFLDGGGNVCGQRSQNGGSLVCPG